MVFRAAWWNSRYNSNGYWPGSGTTVFVQGGATGGFTIAAVGATDGESGIAGHTYPESIRHRKLFLLAETSVWMQQLLFLKSEILAKITEVMGEDVLTDIVLRVGVAPVPVSLPVEIDGEATSADPAGTPRDFSASIEESLGGVQNDILLERLRALLHKAAASNVSLSRVASEKVSAGA